MAYDEDTASRIRKLLATRTDVVEKKMMGGLCFMTAQGMCCSVSGRGGLLVRVSAADREKALREAHVGPMEMRGRIMKNFVRVAPEAYRTEAALAQWIRRGLDGVAACADSEADRRRPRAARRSMK